MYTFNPTHTPARSLFHTGTSQLRALDGTWLSYGLGSENRDLPGFVVWEPERIPAAAWLARASCLRSIRARSSTIGDAPDKMIRYLQNKELDTEAQRRNWI